MMRRAGVFLSVLTVALAAQLALASCVFAQDDKSDKDVKTEQASAQSKRPEPFRVLSHALHSEAPTAEICLTLSHPLAEPFDRAQIAAALRLKRMGRVQKVGADSLSLTQQEICLQGLEHRLSYQLAVQGLVSKSGRRLAAAYTASFSVPDRKPSLSFIVDSSLPILPRHVKTEGKEKAEPQPPRPRGMAHVLRSVGVLATHLTLYRMEDKSAFAPAWAQFKQAHLSPSESLAFARERGKIVFESDLVFGDEANIEQTLIAPLPADDALPAGLYYLAAAPRGKMATSLFAGQWFLVSDMRLGAMAVAGGVQAFVFAGEKAAPLAGASVSLLAPDGKSIAEGQTDTQGQTFLKLPQGQRAEGLIALASRQDGSADMLEITPARVMQTTSSARLGSMLLDREGYAPESVAQVRLQREGEAASGELAKAETFLKVLRPDRQTLYEMTAPAPADARAPQTILMPVPVWGKIAIWTLSWQDKNGRVLAEEPLRVVPDGAASKISLTTSRSDDPASGIINITLMSQDDKGRPLAYQEGLVRLEPTRPIVEGVDAATRFGVTPEKEGQTVLSLPFMTNGTGMAHIAADVGALRLKAEAFAITATTSLGARSQTVRVMAAAPPLLIGIRSAAGLRPFAENATARFDIFGLDRARKKTAQDNLFAVLYEEGRSFDWYEGEGHWDYRPLPQHRRIGGRPLSLSGSEDTPFVWPVTMGRYALEIANASGTVLARRSFEAGRGGERDIAEDESVLRIGALPDAAPAAEAAAVPFKLSAPAMVQAVVADGNVRHTVQRRFDAGEHALTFTPSGDWGRAVTIRIDASLENAFETVTDSATLPIRAASLPEAQKPATAPPTSNASANTKAAPAPLAGEGALLSELAKPLAAKSSRTAIPHYVLLPLEGKRTLTLGITQPAPQKSPPAKAGKTDAKDKQAKTPTPPPTIKPEGLILSPIHLPEGLDDGLAALLSDAPQTSQEIASWIEAARLWQPALTGSGFAPQEALQDLIRVRTATLLRRQNEDGGIAALRAGGPSDLAATAAALWVLSDAAPRMSVFAASWLAERMKNTWFDESERQDRAAAFEALAHVKRLDMSALRYFAETSLDKKLSPAALASLAAALYQGGDQNAAGAWAEKAKAALSSDAKDNRLPLALAARSAAGQDPMDAQPFLTPSMTNASPLAARTPRERAALLSALARMAARAGSWRVAVDGTETKRTGISGWRSIEEPAPKQLSLNNIEDRALYGLKLTTAAGAAAPQPATTVKDAQPTTLSLSYSLHRMNGEALAANQNVDAGETLLLIVKGQGQKDRAAPLRLTVAPTTGAAAFLPLSEDPALHRLIAPFLQTPATPVREIASDNGGASVVLDGKSDFTVPFYLRAEKGWGTQPLRFQAWDDSATLTVNVGP